MWIASSREDLCTFPEDVKDGVGHALWFAQINRKYDSAKPLKGFGGAGVLEVVETFDGNTYRAAYTVKFERLLVKAELSARIVDIIRARGLTQTAAKVLDVDQPRVSALFHGKIRQFSVDRLIRFLTALDRDVRIVVARTSRRRRGKVIVESA